MPTQMHFSRTELEAKVAQLQMELDRMKINLSNAKTEEKFATLTDHCNLHSGIKHRWALEAYDYEIPMSLSSKTNLKVEFRCMGCSAKMQVNGTYWPTAGGEL